MGLGFKGAYLGMGSAYLGMEGAYLGMECAYQEWVVHTYFFGFLNHTINFFDQKKVPNNKTNLGKGYLIRKSGNLIWLVLNKQQYGPKMSEKKVQVL